jgi:benzoyl-CoA reductase/2-hydroxyglutaryl-CoA dehydratase subunit BcrC/BadD/HgdB
LQDPSTIVGLTSTVPVEIVFAAGLKPMDLNNFFITSPARDRLLNQAEQAGFAHSTCAWIKGIYSTVLDHHLTSVIAVTGGDCSNTLALAEVLERRGIRIFPFDYPADRSRESLEKQISKLAKALGTTWSEIEKVKARLDRVRKKLQEMDRLTYRDGLVSGFENHFFLVTSSDFGCDVDAYEIRLDRFLEEARKRNSAAESIRVGFLGVPPIVDGIYEFLESVGCRVVFNEVQRQFSIPFETPDLIERYLKYTYPYGIGARIEDIRHAVQERKLDGLIHYTQTFCYRQIYDIILRESLPLPLLTIEGDRPGKLDSRTQIRLESFVEMLKMKKADFP